MKTFFSQIPWAWLIIGDVGFVGFYILAGPVEDNPAANGLIGFFAFLFLATTLIKPFITQSNKKPS